MKKTKRKMMKKIKKGLAHQQKVYDFAVENYEKSWTSDLKTC